MSENNRMATVVPPDVIVQPETSKVPSPPASGSDVELELEVQIKREKVVCYDLLRQKAILEREIPKLTKEVGDREVRLISLERQLLGIRQNKQVAL